KLVRTTEDVGTALERIKSEGFLSLPVIDENDSFVGVLSRRYIYENFFTENETSKELFLQKKVSEFMKQKLPVIYGNIYIEEAALQLFQSRLTFLPVIDEHTGQFKGIITSGKLMSEYEKIFGLKYSKMILFVYDFKGKMAHISGIIDRAGGNIKNVVQMDTEVMGLQEIILRIETKDIKRIVSQLEKEGFEVRDFSE
ncbi:MAG: CBS domain-containing protein, partial [Vallitaleaceae bacterium]|nr:CBS domain-containing protein [Vallitaleaceae bacterium]